MSKSLLWWVQAWDTHGNGAQKVKREEIQDQPGNTGRDQVLYSSFSPKWPVNPQHQHHLSTC